jgi:hypothetical protein
MSFRSGSVRSTEQRIQPMRNLLALFGALVLGFGGVGWYMGWYTIHFGRTPDGNIHLEADVDQKKVIHDTEDGAKQVGHLIGSQAEKAQQAAKETPPVNTPGPATTPQGDPAKVGGWFGSEGTPPAPPTPPAGTGK